MPGMRILHSIPGRNWGGMEERTLEQMRWLVDHGHDVWLATPAAGEAYRRAQARGLPAVPFEFDPPWRPSTLVAMRRLVRSRCIEVIDAHVSRDAKVAIGCLDLCAVVRSRHVTQSLTTSPDRRLQWRLGADWVVAAADCIRDQLIKAGLVDPERSSTIGEWAEDRFFHAARQAGSARARLRAEFGVDADTPLLACIGMLRPDKGQDVLVRAISALRARGTFVRCLLVGAATSEGAGWKSGLHNLIADSKVAGLVTFTGYREDVPELMMAADLVVVPSLTEAQSRVAVQALAAKRPVVASRTGCIPEVVEDGVTGWLVPPADPDALAGAIAAAVAQPTVAEARAAEGHRRVAATMRIEHQMARTLDAYRAAIAHAQRRLRTARIPRKASQSAASALTAAWHSIAAAVPTSAIVSRFGETRRLLKIAAILAICSGTYLLSQTSSQIEIFMISAGSAGLAELGDETQFLALALTARFGRGPPVFWGVLLATLVSQVILALAGEEAVALIGGDWSRWLLIALLALLGVWMVVPENTRPLKIRPVSSAFLTTFALMFLGDIGDKSEIATVLLAAKYESALAVVLATTTGILTMDALPVFFGRAIADKLPQRPLRWSTAVLFLWVGVATLRFS